MRGVFIGWGTKFEKFRIFLDVFGAVKTTSFSVQTVEFIFKRSNFNLSGPIRSRHVTTTRQPQRQVVVRMVPSGATARPSSSTGGSTRPEQELGVAPSPAATLSKAGGCA
jgi:hypothetical protein